MKMKNEYLDIVRREEKREYFWYSLKAWTMVLLVTGAAALLIVHIVQHPSHKTEQHESDQHNIPLQE